MGALLLGYNLYNSFYNSTKLLSIILNHTYVYSPIIAKNVWQDSRIGKKVMCRSAYSYVFGICLYGPNTFSVLPNLSVFSTRNNGGQNYICEYRSESYWILVNTGSADQFSQLYINRRKNAREYRWHSRK